jgi:hypothetical protein
MACRYCGHDGHNAATCPKATRCSACGQAGHNTRTCPNARRCGICGAVGHDARNCTEGEQVDRPLAAAVDRLYRNTPVPRGAKLVNFSDGDGWFDRDADEQRLAGHIETLPVFEQLGAAFRALVATVHKASRHGVYVGRTGATATHILARFEAHRERRGARWIRPVFRAETERIREQRWEEAAIRWVKMHDARGSLCCNNDVHDQRGPWPRTEHSVIYVVACP